MYKLVNQARAKKQKEEDKREKLDQILYRDKNKRGSVS